MLVRLFLFLLQLEMLKSFINSIIFFASIDLLYQLRWILSRLRCLCGFMLKWYQNINRDVFFSLIDQYTAQSFTFLPRSSPRDTMFEMATSSCSFYRLSAFAIICLDIAYGVSSNERLLVPKCSMYKEGSKFRFVGLI